MYDPMSRRAVVRFAVAGVVLVIMGLVLRPVSIGAAVAAFLLATGLVGLAGYGMIDRLVDRYRSGR